MQDFLYHNGDLVIELCGDMLVTRERGRYTVEPKPPRNHDFENQMDRWLELYKED